MQAHDLHQRIGPVVRGTRLRLGLSQEAVAERVGVSPEFIGRVERGQALPSVPTLLSLSEVLGVGVDVLVGRAQGEGPRVEGSVELRRLVTLMSELPPRSLRLLVPIVVEMGKATRVQPRHRAARAKRGD